MSYIIYDKIGKILRVVNCSRASSLLQAKEDEFIMKGTANDTTQKIVNGIVTNKTPEEIEAEKPPEVKPIPVRQQPANIANEQWQNVLDRLSKLETEI